MEAIKTIGMSICITLVVTSIFSMLVPDTKLDKVIKFAISLFFLTSLISPFFTSDIKFRIDVDNLMPEKTVTSLDEATQTQFLSLATKNIESAVLRILKNDGINVQKVEVLVNKTEDSNISITKLMVYIDNDTLNLSRRIEDLVKKEVGITPSIVTLNNIKTKENVENEVINNEIR